ncbi:hypothetical protein DFH11DRAFT_1735402 [Phellopilus nigrolimitatus]|nr:hypothetical protein DFH11DRAFT_1735402 [Phellopilus nigrolimitatus]
MGKRKKDKNENSSARVKILRIEDSDSDDAVVTPRGGTSASTVTNAARVVSAHDLKSGKISFRTSYVDDVIDVGAQQASADGRNEEAFEAVFEDTIFEDLPEQLENADAEQHLQKASIAKESKRRRAKTLADWVPFRAAYLDELVRLDGRGMCTSCYKCLSAEAPWRCLDCFGAPSSCEQCLVDSHNHSPLHRIEKWTGAFWEKSSLRSLGLKVHLGHAGEPCTSPSQEQYLVVYHVNGFHLVDIIYCGCDMTRGNLHKRNQLMRARWYPATTKDPGTAFTYAMLDQFHELTLQGKISAHDYYQGLAHMSDGSGVRNLPKRYDEFLRSARCYRHLVLAKRSARAHDPSGVDSTKNGQLGLDCPACPHPGKNLPPDWEQSATPWIYTLVLAIDANFRLKSKDRGVSNDPPLGPGWAYIVDPVPYHEQLRVQSDKDIHKVERGSCESTFQAMEKATTRLNDGYLVTGVGAVICARSGLVRKDGVGDLQKGESIVGVLVSLMLVTYDIACQWNKKLTARVREYPHELQAAFFNMLVHYAVPKFHLKGHGEVCQSPYSLNLLRHSARTDGEGIERGWSHINPIATATREMGPGFRHDTIDDHWSAWNWRKIIGLGIILLRKLTEAEEMYAKHQKKFIELSETFEPGVLAAWNAMVDIWQKDPLHAPDPYADPDTHVSLADLRKELAKEEASYTDGTLTVDDLTASTFLVKGLELEDLGRTFKALVAARKAKPHTVQSAVLQERKTTLLSKINKWRNPQLVFMPCAAIQVAQAAADATATAPDATDNSSAPPSEKHFLLDIPPLCLPSELNSDLMGALPTRYKLHEKELRLRFAQAEDSLAELRRLLRLKSSSLTFKKLNNVGQRENTRARSVIVQFTGKIELIAERYRAARAALKRLDPDGEWENRLQPLLSKDVRGIDEDEDVNKKKSKRSEGRREISWIWTRMRSNEGGDAEIDAGIRVEWAKAQARAERWREETVLVVEEMRRTLEYCDWKAAWWREQAALRIVSEDPTLTSGLHACAEKQAVIWEGLGTSFATRWYKMVTARGHALDWPERYRIVGEATRSVPTVKRKRTTLALARAPFDNIDSEAEEERREHGQGSADTVANLMVAGGSDKETIDGAIVDGGERILIDEGEDDCREFDSLDLDLEDNL